MNHQPDAHLISVTEAAKLVGRTDRTVRRWIAEGRLGRYQVNGHLRVDSQELGELQQTQVAAPAGLVALIEELTAVHRAQIAAAEQSARTDERVAHLEAEAARTRQQLEDLTYRRWRRRRRNPIENDPEPTGPTADTKTSTSQ